MHLLEMRGISIPIVLTWESRISVIYFGASVPLLLTNKDVYYIRAL
jgi:hypothetical protein